TPSTLFPSQKCKFEVSSLIKEFGVYVKRRNDILSELITKVLISANPTTDKDYLWFLKFSVAVLLLRDLSVSVFTLQGHLLTKCFSLPTTIWDANPAKIDYFSSELYKLIDDHKNLIFVTNQIESRSSLGFYVSLCMLWKALHQCVGEKQNNFRLYPPSDLIRITTKMSAKRLDKDSGNFLQFLIFHSKIASLIFHRKPRFPHYKCYEEFFAYDATLIKTLARFLEKTLSQAESMWRRDNENFDYLTMIEYVQVDISEFDTLLANYKK
ncbi:hypothetical protein Bhyg_12004, partial [Pseudolycoriella hygida]